ncbi:MAG: hypothetical protein JO267_12035 [Alphaproteobacteria bacterium]|nr:hypothetical protein [Alphaproteobacteria bacterium]
MRACTETASLADLMDDPMVAMLMKSDGVDRPSLENLLSNVAQQRGRALAGQEPLRPR